MEPIKSKIKHFRKKLLHKALGVDISLLQNTYSLQQISKLLHALSGYYPYTSSALDPASLNLVLNDIVINNRKSIVELGSGISTLVIAKLLKTNGIEATFHSLEEDESWATYLTACLSKEQLATYCTVHHVPVRTNIDHVLWYDHSDIDVIKKKSALSTVYLLTAPLPTPKVSNSFARGLSICSIRYLITMLSF